MNNDRSITFLIAIALVAILTGCFGIAHERVLLPPFEIGLRNNSTAQTTNETYKYVYILVPVFYGESNAFISLVKGEVGRSAFYEWKKYDSGNKEAVVFKEEHRYIGSAPPFSPSKETKESRTIFILPEGANNLYRIKVLGNASVIEKTDINKAKAALPALLREKSPDSQRQTEIEEEIKYYRNIEWSKTDTVQVTGISRSKELDRIMLNFKDK